MSPRESPATEPDGATRRGLPRGAWVLLPLVAAGLYAGLASLLRRSPTAAEMVPDDAIATWRFRDVAAYDELRTPPDSAGQVVRHSASDVLGAEINLPALAGIDRRRPLLTVTLDPTRRADPSYWVLPVADASAVRETFASPDLLERHARAVSVHGDWAAAGWDLLAVDRAGSGAGVYPAERGETWAVAVDWPKFVDAALRPESVTVDPVRSVVTALGFDPATGHAEEGEFRVENAGRVPLVRGAWSRVELHAFPGRVRAELWPAADDLVKALAAAAPGPIATAPARAEASLATASGTATRAVATALGYAGLRWPAAIGKDGFRALPAGGAGCLVYAEPAGGTAPSWTVVIEGDAGALPDPAALGLPSLAPGSKAPLPAGATPLTMPFGPVAGGEIATRDAGGRRLVALGIDAGVAAERRAGERPETTPGSPGLLARFSLRFVAAQRLLGPALTKNGLLSSLAGGDLEGTLSVESGRLVLDVHRK